MTRLYSGHALTRPGLPLPNAPSAPLTWWERITIAAVLVAYLLIGD